MHPLLNALPSLGELLASKSKDKKYKSKNSRGTPKQKIAKKEAYVYFKYLCSLTIGVRD